MFMKCKVTVDTSHYPKNGPWDLPKGWEWSMLGDISDYGKCVTVPVSAIKDDAWVLELEDIEKETGRVLKHVTKSVRSINGSRHSFSKKQILFSKLRTYLNKVLIAPDKGFCTTEIIPITPQEGIMPEYLSLVLRSPYFLDYTAQCGYGVKMPRLGTSDAVKAFIPIPPFKEQQRITEVVDRYIDILDRIQSEKEEISIYVSSCKSVILDLAIHGKLVPQDHSDEPAIDLLKRINPNFTPSDNLHYDTELPDGWCLAHIEDVAEYGDTSNVDVASIAPFNWVLELEDIEKDTAFILEKKNKAEREISGVRHSFRKGQVLYSKLRTYLNKVLIAPDDGYCTTEIVPITASKALLSEYLLIVLRSPFFLKYTASCVYGVKMPRLGTNDAKKAIIPIPPLAEQVRIVKKVSDLMEVISSL